MAQSICWSEKVVHRGSQKIAGFNKVRLFFIALPPLFCWVRLRLRGSTTYVIVEILELVYSK